MYRKNPISVFLFACGCPVSLLGSKTHFSYKEGHRQELSKFCEFQVASVYSHIDFLFAVVS